MHNRQDHPDNLLFTYIQPSVHNNVSLILEWRLLKASHFIQLELQVFADLIYFVYIFRVIIKFLFCLFNL